MGVTVEGVFNINKLKSSSSMILAFKICLLIRAVLDTRDLQIKHCNVVTESPASYFKVTDSYLGPAASYTS